jgi:uncharacterized membrane protein YidH (DUF202 family)
MRELAVFVLLFALAFVACGSWVWYTLAERADREGDAVNRRLATFGVLMFGTCLGIIGNTVSNLLMLIREWK